MRPPIRAVIFDMDGVLVESESLWQQAEQEASDELGLGLGVADFESTMGVRMRDVAQIWYDHKPWDGPSVDEVADRVTARVAELVRYKPLLPGVAEALDLVASAGYRTALCTSSDRGLIEAVLDRPELRDRFEVTHSAAEDEHGKPHPMPYLLTASELGVSPAQCVAIEDSVTGAVSAKAAGMRVIAVANPAERGSGRLGFADLQLSSLLQLDHDALTNLDAGVRTPGLSRPRFHRAFPVDDLASARWFYGDVLECLEGRSADTWVDFDFYGHQIVAHLAPAHTAPSTNPVDGHDVPADHMGVVLHPAAWRTVVEKLRAEGDRIRWIIQPNTRFAGQPGEQHTCFVLDPAGNAIEMKAFVNDEQVFAT